MADTQNDFQSLIEILQKYHERLMSLLSHLDPMISLRGNPLFAVVMAINACWRKEYWRASPLIIDIIHLGFLFTTESI